MATLGTVIFLALVTAIATLGILVWRMQSPPESYLHSEQWRKIIGLTGVIAVSLQIFVFVTFEAYGFLIGDFTYRARSFFFWARLDFYLFVVALLAALFGRGRFRVSVAFVALAIEMTWFMIGLAY